MTNKIKSREMSMTTAKLIGLIGEDEAPLTDDEIILANLYIDDLEKRVEQLKKLFTTQV